jgi:hypothetical protein
LTRDALLSFLVAFAVCSSASFGAPPGLSAQSTHRVALGAVNVNGPIPVSEARRVLASARRAFEQCYEDRLRAREGIAGRTVTRIFVSSDGGPIVAQVDESNVGDPELERCIKRASLVLAFSEHESADSHVRFELRFGDTHHPSGQPHTVTAGPEDPRFRTSRGDGAEPAGPPTALRAHVHPEIVAVSGARSEAQISAGLRRGMPRMRACYETSLARDRSLEGELRLRFVVDARGRAERIHVEEDRVGDSTLAACIGRVVETTRFSRGQSGEVVARVRMSRPEGLTGAPAGRRG